MISNIRPKKVAAHIAVAAFALCSAAPFVAAQASGEKPSEKAASAPAASLDFEFFKTRVAPIFLKKRPEHGRCYACHSGTESIQGSRDYLEKLPPGASFWTDEQLHRMFQRISRYVAAGNPDKSLILLRPLAPEAGGLTGKSAHRGGRQFRSKDDPDWKTLSDWAHGAKAGG